MRRSLSLIRVKIRVKSRGGVRDGFAWDDRAHSGRQDPSTVLAMTAPEVLGSRSANNVGQSSGEVRDYQPMRSVRAAFRPGSVKKPGDGMLSSVTPRRLAQSQ